MDTHSGLVRQALQEAYKAYHRGDRLTARQWAQRAVRLDPYLEETWLLLAYLSDPLAKMAYLQQVIKINPGNQQVRDALVWLQVRQQTTSAAEVNVGDTQPVRIPPSAPVTGLVSMPKIPAAIPAPTKSNQPAWIYIAAGSTVVFFLFLLLAVGGIFLFYNTSTVWAAAPGNINQSQWVTSLPTSTVTGVSVRVYVVPPTSTITPIPSVTPTRTSTAVPTRAPTLPPIATALPPGPKRIVVSVSQQRVFAFQGSQQVYQFVASTGIGNNTPLGHFTILDKIPDAFSYSYNFRMPFWMGFTWVGGLEDGFHSLPVLPNGSQIWGNALGTPVTYGCVVLSPTDSQTLFNWVEVGTLVEIDR